MGSLVDPLKFSINVLHTAFVISFYLWYILESSVGSWLKSNLFRFIEGQTHFSTVHAKMSNPKMK